MNVVDLSNKFTQVLNENDTADREDLFNYSASKNSNKNYHYKKSDKRSNGFTQVLHGSDQEVSGAEDKERTSNNKIIVSVNFH